MTSEEYLKALRSRTLRRIDDLPIDIGIYALTDHLGAIHYIGRMYRCRRSQSSAAVLDFIAEFCSKSVRLEAPPRSHSVRSGSDYLQRARTHRVLLTVHDTGSEGG